jgi:hypothetical protein
MKKAFSLVSLSVGIICSILFLVFLFFSFLGTQEILTTTFTDEYNPGLGNTSAGLQKLVAWGLLIILYVFTIGLLTIAYQMLKKAFAVDKDLSTPPPTIPPQQQ